MTNELKETGDFEGYMLEICDLLENGDASIDFAERGQAHEATVIRIIANLVRDELDSIRTMREMEQWLRSPNELPRADGEDK
tara:strand:+ start:988 stop:1233 length:246 start_codon:yes stop_codon:yes gene_type:complete